MRCLCILCFAAALMPLSTRAHDPYPTPVCNSTGIDAEIIPPDPTYIPETTFTLAIRPIAGDWATTPSVLWWRFGDTYIYPAQLEHEFLVSEPAPDQIYISAYVSGPGIRPECPNWSTSPFGVYVRRFDAPTPTPSITISPTPTEPCDPPCRCEPTPTVLCEDLVIYPLIAARDIPTSFILEHRGRRLISLEDLSRNEVIPVSPLGNHRYYVTGLRPNTLYTWFIVMFYDACGDAQTCWPYFWTDPNAPQYPTITPTATPSPDPTISPTPSPSSTPLSVRGWMLTSLVLPGLLCSKSDH